MIDSRKLVCFVAVCQDLHFARAADRLGLAQSAVSTQIRQLEEEVGTRLLHRNKRQPVTLTDAGVLFHAEAVAALRHIERAEQVGRLAARGVAGIVRLGFVGSGATSGLLTHMLSRYRQHHDQVRMEVVALETPRQLAAIHSGEIDVGIVRPRRAYPDGVVATVVHSESLMIAVAQDHPFASRASLKASDLRGQSLVSSQFNEHEGFAETLAELGAAGGFSAVADHKVNDFISAVSLATAGYGIAVVPASVQRFAQPGSVFLRIADFDTQVHLALAHRERSVSPAVAAFLATALPGRTRSRR